MKREINPLARKMRKHRKDFKTAFGANLTFTPFRGNFRWRFH